MTMNAGFIPSDHWVQDHAKGGGRIIGEACHYIDLMKFLANSEIEYVNERKMESIDEVEIAEDKAVITLGFKDGSVGSINYFANGHKSFPKEQIEIFSSGRILQIDNFLKFSDSLRIFGGDVMVFFAGIGIDMEERSRDDLPIGIPSDLEFLLTLANDGFPATGAVEKEGTSTDK